MQIFVKTLTNKTITLDVDAVEDVIHVKNQIRYLQNIPNKHQRLYFGGKLLENGRTLSDYGINNFSVLTLSLSATVYSMKYDINSFLPLIKTRADTNNIYECNPSETIASVFNLLSVPLSNNCKVCIIPDHSNGKQIELTKKQIYTERIFALHHAIRHGVAMRFLLYYNKFNKFHSKEFIFIFINNIISTSGLQKPTRLKVMRAIAQFIRSLKPDKNNKFMLYEAACCLDLFVKNSLYSEIKNENDIVSSILKMLSYGNIDNDEQIALCHTTLLGCLVRYGAADILLQHKTLYKLDFLVDPCQHKNVLNILSVLITSHLTRSAQVLQIRNIDTINTDTIGGKIWIILKHLNLLLLYEDSTKIIGEALNGMQNLINSCANLETDIDVIVGGVFTKEIRSKYLKKQYKNRLLFDGFVQNSVKEVNVEFIPYDIVRSIFNYYNCYEKIETDLLQRLINLFDKNNGYPVGLRNSALSTLQRITQFCYPILSVKLMNNYNLLNEMKKFLMADYSYLDEICWVLSNLSADNIRLVLQADIIEVVVDSFTKMNLSLIGNIIFPLLNVIQLINDDARVHSIILQYEFIPHLTRFMNVMCEDKIMGLNYSGLQIWDKLFAVLEFLLVSHYNRDICIQQMKKNNGIKILNKIKNRQSAFNVIQESVANRAISLIADYFEN